MFAIVDATLRNILLPVFYALAPLDSQRLSKGQRLTPAGTAQLKHAGEVAGAALDQLHELDPDPSDLYDRAESVLIATWLLAQLEDAPRGEVYSALCAFHNDLEYLLERVLPEIEQAQDTAQAPEPRRRRRSSRGARIVRN